MKWLLILIFIISCAQKRTFRRPPKRVSTIEETRIILKNHYQTSKENKIISLEDEELESELNSYFNEMETEEEKKFFDLGKKAVDLRVFFSWPVYSKKVTSPFGYRKHPITKKWHLHKGVDLRASLGTPIHASQKGRVIIEKKSKTYGNVIAIAHSRGYVTLYAHNKINYVKKGELVLKNQKIGEVGSSGLATAPHLHFEIRRYKKHINPIKFINNQKKFLLSK